MGDYAGDGFDEEAPEFEYLCTYGPHEFISGFTQIPLRCNLAQALTTILNKHHNEVATACDGAGSAQSEMYNQFAANQGSLSITCHRNGPRDDSTSMGLGVSDGLIVPVQLGALALHFHLRAHNESSIGPQSDYRRRLNMFYSHYNPTALCAVDGMLYDARGFEEELLAALCARYGPEPGTDRGDVVDVRFRDRLQAYYHHYNPEKLPEVDSILAEYRGCEEQLFAALCGKYGPEPVIMGSELGSEDSYTFTADSHHRDPPDPHPLSVPLMPFFEPLDDIEDDPSEDAGPDLGADVHFWDNFVNQMPSALEEEYGEGLDCNQELLQKYTRCYARLCPHIITLTCPFKEHVFRANEDFWVYVIARSEGQESAVRRAAAAGGEHVLRVVSSLDPQAPCVLTRREWQLLVDDWERANNLVRRVNIGSVVVEAPPEIHEYRRRSAEPPERPPPPRLPAVTKSVQTVCDTAVQTAPPPEPTPDPAETLRTAELAAPPPPQPLQSPQRQPYVAGSPARVTYASPVPTGHLVDPAQLPVAWPVAAPTSPHPGPDPQAVPAPTPRAPPAQRESPTPPAPPQSAHPEDWLIAALPQVAGGGRAPLPAAEGQTQETQTAGWVPPSLRRDGVTSTSPPANTSISPPPRRRTREGEGTHPRARRGRQAAPHPPPTACGAPLPTTPAVAKHRSLPAPYGASSSASSHNGDMHSAPAASPYRWSASSRADVDMPPPPARPAAATRASQGGSSEPPSPYDAVVTAAVGVSSAQRQPATNKHAAVPRDLWPGQTPPRGGYGHPPRAGALAQSPLAFDELPMGTLPTERRLSPRRGHGERLHHSSGAPGRAQGSSRRQRGPADQYWRAFLDEVRFLTESG
eukprot:TRINITY_DN1460_c2_g1_i1.p1 TRINITY_DN1460_c2_g1~~TRINITY_DN1460_c2_g1_i1.p1  ORF type:complete len:887 (+),score=144.02 TRINITY_DN1460_c2_g1_i1:75-2663(+)